MVDGDGELTVMQRIASGLGKTLNLVSSAGESERGREREGEREWGKGREGESEGESEGNGGRERGSKGGREGEGGRESEREREEERLKFYQARHKIGNFAVLIFVSLVYNFLLP